MNILLLIGGLILILLGANGLTDGAASVAKRFRIPPIVIGLTIVAFGTSAPELTVSVSSALKGSADIAIGNVVGSNIFNTLMIVGCTALFAPIVITRNTLRKEIPLCILSSIVLLICANDVFLDKAPENILNRIDGLLLLCFFVIFMGYTFAIASKPGTTEQAGQIEAPTIEEALGDREGSGGRLRRCGTKAGLAGVRQARQRRLQCGHLQGVQSGGAEGRHCPCAGKRPQGGI